MKKLALLLVSITSFFAINEAFAIVPSSIIIYSKNLGQVYQVNSGGGGDTNLGFSTSGLAVMSPDGVYIYNSSGSDGKLYRKRISDGNIEAITSYPIYSSPIRFSPDGGIVYVVSGNYPDYYIRAISTSSIGDGKVLNSSAYVAYGLAFDISVDGKRMYYFDGSDIRVFNIGENNKGTIVKSGVGSTRWISVNRDESKFIMTFGCSGYECVIGGDCTQIAQPTLSCGWFNGEYSPDGTKKVMGNNDSNEIREFTNSNTDSVYLASGTRPIYAGKIPVESCSDGIQNQDETGIDYGGVCGGSVSRRTNENGIAVECTKGNTFFNQYSVSYSKATISSQTSNYSETGSSYRQEIYTDNIVVNYNDFSESRSYFDSSVFINGITGSGDLKIVALADYLINPERKSPLMEIQLKKNTYVRIKADKIGSSAEFWYTEANGTTTKKKAGKFIDESGNITFYDTENRQEINKRLMIRLNTDEINIAGIDIGKWSGGVQSADYCETSDSRIDANYHVSCTTSQYSTGSSIGIYESLSGSVVCGLSTATNIEEPPAACGWYGGYCMPTMDITGSGTTENPYIGTTASGGISYGQTSGSGRVYSSTAQSGSIFDFDLYFNFRDFPSYSTGQDCSKMFDGPRFLYTSAGTSASIKLISNWDVNPMDRWDCTAALINVNPCGTVYDGVGSIMNFGADAINWTITKIFSNVKSLTVFIGRPEQGKSYCFLGEKKDIPVKPQSYYSYVERKDVDTSGPTILDFFIRALCVVAIFRYLSKN